MRVTADTVIAGRYRVRARLAGGGMGEIWAAEDTRLGREVAVKVIRPELAEDRRFAERFGVEARAAAGLSHPGVVAVHDYGDGPEGAYLVMELVRGESLAARLGREGTLDVDTVLDLLAQTGEALQAAHDAGVVHRDVKPANLLWRSDGRVQVTDFGTARALGTATLTAPGALVGTPQYLAPEQAGGGGATAAGDVFALGVVAYEALAGRRPFDGDTVPAVIAALLHADPPPLPETVPPPVAALIADALSKDPSARIPSARTLAARARALRAPDTPVTESLPAPPPAAAPPTAVPPEPAAASSAPAAASSAPAAASSAPAAASSAPAAASSAPAAASPPPPPAEPASGAAAPPLPRPPTPARGKRRWVAGVAAFGVLAVLAVGAGLLLGGGPDAAVSRRPAVATLTAPTPIPSPTATASAIPSATATPSATPTATPSGLRAAQFVGDPAASVVRRLEVRGYDVTLSYSTSTTGSPAPGTVYAIDPDPLPHGSGSVRVIAQPTG